MLRLPQGITLNLSKSIKKLFLKYLTPYVICLHSNLCPLLTTCIQKTHLRISFLVKNVQSYEIRKGITRNDGF